jgi:hypothetical protein
MRKREMSYGAIPTAYRGIQFRSRLEARICCFLDQYNLVWDYEPLDLKNYIPDLIVDLPFGICLLECKPAIKPAEFKPACRKITRSGWVGPAIVLGSQLSLAPDDRADLTMFGSCQAENGDWSRVGRGRWPASWGEYVFPEAFDNWIKAGNQVQWSPPGTP